MDEVSIRITGEQDFGALDKLYLEHSAIHPGHIQITHQLWEKQKQ